MVTRHDASIVAQDLGNRFHPVSIILFGSVAEVGRGNDMDILVIVDEKKEEVRAIDARIQRFLVPYAQQFAVDPFVTGSSYVREALRTGKNPLLQSICSKGVMLYMEDAFNTWMKNAREDLDMARYLLPGEFFRGVCYHAQQALEKAMKAQLLRSGWELEKIHNIRRLRALSQTFNLNINLSDDDTDFMDAIYRGRYPGDSGMLPLSEPGKQDAERAVRCAEKVVGEGKGRKGKGREGKGDVRC